MPIEEPSDELTASYDFTEDEEDQEEQEAPVHNLIDINDDVVYSYGEKVEAVESRRVFNRCV